MREVIENVYMTDGTLCGLLTAVFEAYRRKERPQEVVRRSECPALFDPAEAFEVISDRTKAIRVWRYLEGRVRRWVLDVMAMASRCDSAEADSCMMRVICRITDAPQGYEPCSGDADMVTLMHFCFMARREFEGLVRRARPRMIAEGVCRVELEPRYDVAPLVAAALAESYAGARLEVYDRRRNRMLISGAGRG